MGRREKLVLDYINSKTVDIIQVQVSVPLESVEFVKSLVTDYSNYLEIPYYNLNNEVRKKKVSIISILKNQLLVLKLDEAIIPLPINKKGKENSSILIDEFQDMEEEVENENVVLFKLDIDVRKLFDTIISYQNLKEQDVWLGETANFNHNSCKTIFALLYNLLKEENNPHNIIFKQLHNQVISDKKYYSQFKYYSTHLQNLQINSIEEIKMELLYKIILQTINIVFGSTLLKINNVKPIEIFLSTVLKSSINQKNIMKNIHSVLDYSQTTMDIISGVLSYNMNDSVKKVLDDAVDNFNNNLIPIGYNLKNNFVDIFKNSGLSIDYRGLYKPHGEGYIDAGYSFFKVSGDINNYYKDIKTDKRIQLVNYLNPFNYITRFGYKINDNESSIVFAFTYKLYSLKDNLFNTNNKGMVSLLSNTIESDIAYYKIINKKYPVSMSYITSICLQLSQSKLISQKYEIKTKSKKCIFFTIEYMTKYAIQRMLIDPIKILLSSNMKTKKIILEFNIRKSVEYFLNKPVLSSNYEKIISCYEEILNLIQKYYLKDLITKNINSFKDLELDNNFTLKNLINLLAEDNFDYYKDEETKKEFIENIMIIICSNIPVSAIFLDNSKNSESVEFLVNLVYTYLNTTKYNPFINKNAYAITKICKFVSRQMANYLLDKGYIDKIEYNYLSEVRDMSILNKSKFNKNKMENANYFNHNNLQNCVNDFCLTLIESFL